MNENLEKQAYRLEGFCECHGISRSKAYQEIKKGRLAAFKFGRVTLISREAAQDWLKQVQSESGPITSQPKKSA